MGPMFKFGIGDAGTEIIKAMFTQKLYDFIDIHLLRLKFHPVSITRKINPTKVIVSVRSTQVRSTLMYLIR